MVAWLFKHTSRLLTLHLYFRPPRGSLSHLAMFRIGSLLFIPAYITVTLYRPFASEEGNGNAFLMTGFYFILFSSTHMMNAYPMIFLALAISTYAITVNTKYPYWPLRIQSCPILRIHLCVYFGGDFIELQWDLYLLVLRILPKYFTLQWRRHMLWVTPMVSLKASSALPVALALSLEAM